MDVGEENPWPVGGSKGWSHLGATVRDRVAHELRDRILTGQLGAGMRIDLDDLARDFGTSRTPVREACLTLMHEGLVRMAPRSGVTVLGVTAQDTLDNFALMAVLSGVAASWAARRISEEQLVKVRTLKDDIVRAAGGDGDIAKTNWLFHREINKSSRSERLMALLGQTGRMIPPTFFDVIPEQIPCSLSEHDELVEALSNHDAERAREVTERHFASAGRLLSRHLLGSTERRAGA